MSAGKFWARTSVNRIEKTTETMNQPLQRHSQLWDRADLDYSFLASKSSPQPEIKVHLYKSPPTFAVFSLIFNRLLKTLFGVSFRSSYDILFIISGYKQYLSCLRYMQISYEMVSNAHVRRLFGLI